MSEHITESIVVHCIDFRLQKHLDSWLKETVGIGNFDRVSLAGGVLDFEYVLGQIEISEKLHQIKRVILINHQDCGAYQNHGKDEQAKKDLIAARKRLIEKTDQLEIETYFLHLDGTFEEVKNTWW